MTESVEQLRNTYPLGARIRLTDESVGTVRYVGEVEGHKGTWLGVEWDEQRRGKHDGSVNGVQYFNTRCPTSGSMIRPGRVATRQSLRNAIEQKYILTASHTVDDRLVAETRRKLHASIFEIVGMDKVKEKQSHWDGLNVVSVENSTVYMAGILTQLVHLTELHLTDSLINDWGTVADILRQVPSVQHLNLSENQLQPPSDEQLVEWRPHFKHLRAINLRRCALQSWPQVLQIACMWPAIRKVSLQENALGELTAPDTAECFGQLETLDLSQNGITDFAQIINLGRLATLRSLNLAENELRSVELPDCEANEHVDIFVALADINLKENPIEDQCAAFNELDKLAALTTLLYTVEGRRGFEAMFSNSVARMSGLQTLNAMPFLAADRRGAEYDLWKAHGAEWLKADEKDRRVFGKKYRSYHRLVEKYGSPDICIVAPKVANLITIHMHTGEISGGAPLSKRVSRKMSVQALQGIALKLLSAGGGLATGVTLPLLSYLDSSRGNLKIAMDNLSKSLDYYSVQDGDTVIVDW